MSNDSFFYDHERTQAILNAGVHTALAKSLGESESQVMLALDVVSPDCLCGVLLRNPQGAAISEAVMDAISAAATAIEAENERLRQKDREFRDLLARTRALYAKYERPHPTVFLPDELPQLHAVTTRACINVIPHEHAFRVRGLPFPIAWGVSWWLCAETLRCEAGEEPEVHVP